MTANVVALRPAPAPPADAPVAIVDVWFGSHLISHYEGTPEQAARQARGMHRRFPGLRIHNPLTGHNWPEPLDG